jgi:flavin reductase (DIM6/NTAB) family NADH-FMN oxidoreductase RutF
LAEMHFYEPAKGHRLKHDPFNAIIAPRPIGWISTQDQAGRLNLAPYSFFNAFNYWPPILGFSTIGWKDTIANIEQTGEFVWQLATRELAQAMNLSSTTTGPEVDEFALAGLTTASSQMVAVPRVAQARVAMECHLTQILQLKTASGADLQTWAVFGEVVGVHIDQTLVASGVYDTTEPVPILRTGGAGGYVEVTGSSKFDMPRPR